MKKVIFYFGHPSQYLFLRYTIKDLIEEHKIRVSILIKTKDVLESLVKADGLEYRNILQNVRGNSRLAIFKSLISRILNIMPIIIKERPSLLIGLDPSLSYLGKIFRIKHITITDDDYEVFKTLANISYPFTTSIVCPVSVRVGKWTHKKIGYKGYMKLSYLHPNVFTPNKEIVDKYGFLEEYVLIRLAKLTAHHDFGAKGINKSILLEMIKVIETSGKKVFISSEGHLDEDFKHYVLNINPEDMHHVLAFSNLLVCDSQSMSVEASMLGVPSIRYNTFVRKISVLDELEDNYELTYGIYAGDESGLIHKLKELVAIKNLRDIFQVRRKKMLKEKIDVSKFMTWYISNYPKSDSILREDIDYQNKFK